MNPYEPIARASSRWQTQGKTPPPLTSVVRLTQAFIEQAQHEQRRQNRNKQVVEWARHKVDATRIGVIRHILTLLGGAYHGSDRV